MSWKPEHLNAPSGAVRIWTKTVEDEFTHELVAVVYASSKEVAEERAAQIAAAGDYSNREGKTLGQFLKEHFGTGEPRKIADEEAIEEEGNDA